MQDKQAGSNHFILFEIAGTTYAVRSRLVQQVEMIEHITPVPNASAHVEGVVFSRGQVTPALSLRARFGLEKTPHDLRTRLIVVSTGGRTVGLIVDTAREFKIIPEDKVQPPHEAISGLSGKYLEGIARLDERIVLLLDLDEVIDVTESILPAPDGV